MLIQDPALLWENSYNLVTLASTYWVTWSYDKYILSAKSVEITKLHHASLQMQNKS